MKVLIVEDEYGIADAVRDTLEDENFECMIAPNGLQGLEEALTGIYDLILLDVMLPKMNGFEVLKELQKEKIETPVIMLTAKQELEDKLEGLEHGADDYITKPFHMKELIARIKVVIKRKSNLEDLEEITYGDLTLNKKQGLLTSNQKEIQISGKELDLIEFLLINKDHIIEKDLLQDKIWGYDSDALYNSVEVYISFLRKKLKTLGSTVKIVTVRGLGYKLEK